MPPIMADFQQTLIQRFADALANAFGDEVAEVDPLIGPAKNPRFGDYQANVAMSLGKRLGSNPRQVAEKIVEHLDVADLCEPPTIAGPGFINLRLTDAALADHARALAGDAAMGIAPAADPQTVVVDYSSPNVAKEMHVGHLRSTVIGDALVRVLEAAGHRVIRQNHLGDWGTQFGMLIETMADTGVAAGAQTFHVGDLNELYRQAKARFDQDAAFADRARQRVVLLQAGDPDSVNLWHQLVAESQRHFNEAYDRLGVRLADEDVRGESAYNAHLPEVIQALVDAGVARQSEGAIVVFVDGYESPMIVRKRDGGYGYDATDLAALRYRVQQLDADRLIYVTDARQGEHFAKLFDAGRRMGWLDNAAAEHVTFGMVLGEDNRPFKTRSGDTVRLRDLLDEARQRAAAIVAEKNPDLTEIERQQVARVVGIGAIKYGDLSSDRSRDYVFSWNRMLAMDGNTAPYLQYAYARIRSIFRRGQVDPATLGAGELTVGDPAERALVLKLAQLPGVVRAVAANLQPHHLCTYLYELATTFSSFYEQCPVLRADDAAARTSRLVLCDLTARALERGLGLLGIDVLERM